MIRLQWELRPCPGGCKEDDTCIWLHQANLSSIAGYGIESDGSVLIHTFLMTVASRVLSCFSAGGGGIVPEHRPGPMAADLNSKAAAVDVLVI